MNGSLASWSWRSILSVAAAGLVLCTALPARAGIIVSVQSVPANKGTSGNTLEVDVLNTGVPVDIAGFSFEISVAAGSGVSFTGADTNTSTNLYIFAGNSLFGPNIYVPSVPPSPTTLDASDLAASGSTTLGTNSTLGLGRVFFDVASSAPGGPVTVSLTDYPATGLVDPNGNPIPIDTRNNGTIMIMGGGGVPEPSALVSATLGLLGGAWLIRRMRRTARRVPLS
ncbi:MAG: hypothetical protein ACHRXM_21680 [Isosphaerales bacterium]